MLSFVYMQIFPAICIDSSAISCALRSVNLFKGARCGKRICAARADADDAVVGLDQISVAGNQERVLIVGDNHHRFEMTQRPIRSPVFREFDGRSAEIAVKLLELRFESWKTGETESAEDPAKPARILSLYSRRIFLRAVLDDRIAESHLAVAGNSDFSLLADTDNRCRTRLEFHGCYFLGTVNRVSGKPELYVAVSSRISMVLSPSVVRLRNNGVRIP